MEGEQSIAAPAGAENPLFVASVEKAMRVLAIVSERSQPLSIAEIGSITGLGRSASQRFVFTLHALGYLHQDASTRRYMLSARFLGLCQGPATHSVLARIAYPILKSVNEACEETVNLTVPIGNDVLYILRLPSRHAVSVNLSVGACLPAYCTAPGRAILSRLDPGEARRIVESSARTKRTELTETDPDRIMERVVEAAWRGYAMNDQEAFIGDVATAAAVCDPSGRPVAAVNVAVPTPRWTLARVEAELTPVVTAAAGEISYLL